VRALDTNVLVRALVQDDAAQGRRAQACLSAQPVYVPVTVILELEWVLRSRYGYSPKAIADAMEKLAILENAVVGEQAAVVAAAGTSLTRFTTHWQPAAMISPHSTLISRGARAVMIRPLPR
jgi:predicted nucleic-acid-binding protein